MRVLLMLALMASWGASLALIEAAGPEPRYRKRLGLPE